MKKETLCFKIMGLILVLSILLPLSGCITVNRLKKETQQQAAVIDNLNMEIERLSQELRSIQKTREELEKAKLRLQEKLKDEIRKKQAIIQMKERGLVVTVVAEVLFDPGKAKIKPEFKKSLDKIIEVLKENVPDKQIVVEGHTDSDPIRYSGWKSNWELSTARATSIIHYFINKGKLDPKRLSAVGYGPYRPVASNKTEEGKAKNRRVEIIILPQTWVKKRPAANK